MTSDGCQGCADVEIWRKKAGAAKGTKSVLSAKQFRSEDISKAEEKLTVVVAKADEIRKCEQCKADFIKAFNMPELWWTWWCRKSNGYFGSDKTVDDKGQLDTYQTWFRFIIKRTYENKPKDKKKDYVWYKFNIFTSWVASTQRTAIVVFDPHSDIKDDILDHLFKSLPEGGVNDPYVVHSCFLEDIIRHQDEAVWSVRTLVRNTEIKRTPTKKQNSQEEEKSSSRKKLGILFFRPAAVKPDHETTRVKPNPNYFQLYEVARHTIHVLETLDVAVNIMTSMMKEHGEYDAVNSDRSTDKPAPITISKSKTRTRLSFFDNVLRSLRSRAASNKDRLVNEIQLSFNELAHFDSNVSINIGRAAQVDSRAMKTIAFLTLVFLPATFISSIFSMSFFDFDPEKDKWIRSGKFWIYWAFTIPITLLTLSLWSVWSWFSPPELVGDENDENTDQNKAKNSQELKRSLEKLMGKGRSSDMV